MAIAMGGPPAGGSPFFCYRFNNVNLSSIKETLFLFKMTQIVSSWEEKQWWVDQKLVILNKISLKKKTNQF